MTSVVAEKWRAKNSSRCVLEVCTAVLKVERADALERERKGALRDRLPVTL